MISVCEPFIRTSQYKLNDNQSGSNAEEQRERNRIPISTLETAGFKNIHRYDWRETIHKDYGDFSRAYIPPMDKEHGILISLNVEAEKR